MDDTLCPFSKPIIGHWCDCPHASVAERCSGKMSCNQAAAVRDRCLALVDVLRERSRFVLGSPGGEVTLTHAQLMKIRCGGLLGMQRVLQLPSATPPRVLEVIAAATRLYGDVQAFPFNEIMQDIQAFHHRRKQQSNRKDR